MMIFISIIKSISKHLEIVIRCLDIYTKIYFVSSSVPDMVYDHFPSPCKMCPVSGGGGGGLLLGLWMKTGNSNVKIGHTIIDEVNSTKLLGVNVANTLYWTMQVAQVKKCTSYRLFLFWTIRNYLPLETRIKYYDYYVKPLIKYCSSVWGICSKENQTKIIKIQKKAARLILD